MNFGYRATAMTTLIFALHFIQPQTLGSDRSYRYPPGFGVSAGELQGPPHSENLVHKTGRVHLSVTNFGLFGAIAGSNNHLIDPDTDEPAASCQFPAFSGIEYIYFGSLWFGAVVDEDPLVSVGNDGWLGCNELLPEPFPHGEIIRRSTDPASAYFSPLAISDMDLLAVYFDTMTNPAWVPQPDGIPHRPLGLRVRQTSYSWSKPAYQDFVILSCSINNIGDQYLSDFAVGIYCDADIWLPETPPRGWQHDLTGSIRLHLDELDDSILVGWAADNDGDPVDGNWTDQSPRGVLGITLLDSPDSGQISYNWWMSSGDCGRDWGPSNAGNPPFDVVCSGTPISDAEKYGRMTNGEIDYDQMLAASMIESGRDLFGPADPWIPREVADGYDTRFLYSFGSTALAPGDSLHFAFVIAMGENFHTDPAAFDSLFDYEDPSAFYETLDFSDLMNNVVAAKGLYDSLRYGSSVAVEDDIETLPKQFTVLQNYPNPFNNSTVIEFNLRQSSRAEFEVFNILGEKVWSQELDGVIGRNVVSWEAADEDGDVLPSGVYFYRIVAGESSVARKMILLK